MTPKVCNVDGCDKEARAVGMCLGHYYRKKRGSKATGPIKAIDKPNTDIVTRLERKSIPEPNTGCWLWMSAFGGGGYGTITVNGRSRAAHRVSYEAYKGSISDGLQLDHLCRERSCVNPDHLEPVTLGENIRRGISHHGSKTHCPHGHAYDEQNTGRTKTGGRYCRACARMRMREKHRAKRAEACNA